MSVEDLRFFPTEKLATSPCRGCGKPIIWIAEEKTGKKIPLDPRPPVYEVTESFDAREKNEPANRITFGRRNLKAYVSHFATCPDADRFSGSRKSS